LAPILPLIVGCCTTEDVHEVDASFDVRDVHEHRGPAEARPQVVEEPAGMAGTVFTPIADEDAGRDASSR
jgi:hypothetical protein